MPLSRSVKAMPLAQNSTDARRCLSTVVLCAGSSTCSQATRPRDATCSSCCWRPLNHGGHNGAFSSRCFFSIYPLRDMRLSQVVSCQPSPSLGMRLTDSSSDVVRSPCRANSEWSYGQKHFGYSQSAWKMTL